MLDELRAGGMDLLGPLPADTAFNPKVLERCDAVFAMYHDQGLPVLKYAGFGKAINITLGCRSSAPRSTTVRHWTWPAAAGPTPAAWNRRWTRPSA